MGLHARTWFTPKQRAELWERWRSGQCVADVARALERRNKSGVYRVLALSGGIAPLPRRRAAQALRLAEREEISRGIVAGRSMRQIAQNLGRSPSTVSREVSRNGGCSYRASWADRRAWDRALRPKRCRLARHAELRWRVAQKLARQWSPKQIAGWLKQQFPADQGMQVSHETIYRSLFIQTRGVLKKQLMAHLRTARQMRQGRHDEEWPGTDRRCDFYPRTAGRGRGPRCARSLGRRSALRSKQHPHRDVGRAPYPLCDAAQDSEQGHRDRGCRAR